jgi:hypothetical protein
MAFDPNKPYNDLPPLPPKADLETKAVLKKTIAANKALAELKGAGDLIPNQSVLIHAIGLQEAKLSSEIENVVTTNDELYRAFADAGHNANPQTKEVLHYSGGALAWFRRAAGQEASSDDEFVCGPLPDRQADDGRNSEGSGD